MKHLRPLFQPFLLLIVPLAILHCVSYFHPQCCTPQPVFSYCKSMLKILKNIIHLGNKKGKLPIFDDTNGRNNNHKHVEGVKVDPPD